MSAVGGPSNQNRVNQNTNPPIAPSKPLSKADDVTKELASVLLKLQSNVSPDLGISKANFTAKILDDMEGISKLLDDIGIFESPSESPPESPRANESSEGESPVKEGALTKSTLNNPITPSVKEQISKLTENLKDREGVLAKLQTKFATAKDFQMGSIEREIKSQERDITQILNRLEALKKQSQ